MAADETSTWDAKACTKDVSAHVKLEDLSSQLQFQEFVQDLLSQKEQISEEEREILMELNSEGEDFGDDEMAEKCVKLECKTDLNPVIKIEPHVTNSLVKYAPKRKLEEYTYKLDDEAYLTTVHERNKKLCIKEFPSVSLAHKISTDNTVIEVNAKIHQSITNLNHSADYCQDFPALIKVLASTQENETILPDLIECSDTMLVTESSSSSTAGSENGKAKKEHLENKSISMQEFLTNYKITKIRSNAPESNQGHNECTISLSGSSNNAKQPRSESERRKNRVVPDKSTAVDGKYFTRLDTISVPSKSLISSKNSQPEVMGKIISNLNPKSKDASLPKSQTQKEQLLQDSSIRKQFRNILPKDFSSQNSTPTNPKLNFFEIAPSNLNKPSMQENPALNFLQNPSLTSNSVSSNVAAASKSKEPNQSSTPLTSVLNVRGNTALTQNLMFTNPLVNTFEPISPFQNVLTNLSSNIVGYIIPGQNTQSTSNPNFVSNVPGFLILPQNTSQVGATPNFVNSTSITKTINLNTLGECSTTPSFDVNNPLKIIRNVEMVKKPNGQLGAVNSTNSDNLKLHQSGSVFQSQISSPASPVTDTSRNMQTPKVAGKISAANLHVPTIQSQTNNINSNMSQNIMILDNYRVTSTDSHNTSRTSVPVPLLKNSSHTSSKLNHIRKDNPIVTYKVSRSTGTLPSSEKPLTILGHVISPEHLRAGICSSLESNNKRESSTKLKTPTTSVTKQASSSTAEKNVSNATSTKKVVNDRPIDSSCVTNSVTSITKNSSTEKTVYSRPIGSRITSNHIQAKICSRLQTQETIIIDDEEIETIDKINPPNKSFNSNEDDIQVVFSSISSSSSYTENGEVNLARLGLKLWRKCFKCKICDERFSDRENMQKHIKQVHQKNVIRIK